MEALVHKSVTQPNMGDSGLWEETGVPCVWEEHVKDWVLTSDMSGVSWVWIKTMDEY